MEQKPSIGRIVRYVDARGTCSAAVITGIFETSEILVDLTVFPSGDAPYWVRSVPENTDDSPVGDSWHWPPRV